MSMVMQIDSCDMCRRKGISMMSTLTYAQRSALHANPAAKQLLGIMERKKTNLCVSVDVTKKASLLAIVDAVGSSVCLVKASVMWTSTKT